MFGVAAAVYVVLYLAIALCVVVKYRRTRVQGYLWLGLALVVWPVVDVILSRTVEGALVSNNADSHSTLVFPPHLVATVRMIKHCAEYAIFLTAILTLRCCGNRNVDMPPDHSH